MLIGLLLLLVLVGILVLASAGSDAPESTPGSSADRSTARLTPPLQLPPAGNDLAGPAPLDFAPSDDAAPSPTLTIPVGPGTRAPAAYVLHLTREAGAWRVAALDPASAASEVDVPTDTLTLTIVVPWRELERDYQWLKVVLR